MGSKLYLECNAGISGDMAVAALLDLGADREVLRNVLDTIPAEGYEIEISRVKKAGIDCCDFNVKLDAEHENHDHDMEYLHGHTDQHGHDEHGQHHDHEHHHDHHHHHEHRGMAEITEILSKTEMTDSARALALKIFDILAGAEAKAHATTVENVHFHEVGAIDSIVDIVAFAVCMDNLQIRDVIVPYVCEGTGTVRCQHGVLPIPVPATSNIIANYDISMRITDVSGEFVTPTGAAFLAAVTTEKSLPEQFAIRKIGIGAGKRTYERPSILRAMLIEEETKKADTIWKLETNIDDCTGEVLGYVMEELFASGAKDVHYTPVYMKKNRPGWQLNVICSKEDIEKMEEIIFRETTTLGIRKMEMKRNVLEREVQTVRTEIGEADVKICRTGEGCRYYPEYESVAAISRKEKIPYMEAYRMIRNEAMRQNDVSE